MADPAPHQEQARRNATFDLLIKAGGVLALPLVVAAVALYVTVNVEATKNKQQQDQIENQKKQIELLIANDKEVRDEIGDLKVTIGQMEVKLDGANEKLTEIRTLVLQGSGN